MYKTIGLLGMFTIVGCSDPRAPTGTQDSAGDPGKADNTSAPDFLPSVQLRTAAGNTVSVDFVTDPPLGAGFTRPSLVLTYQDDANLFAHALGIDTDVVVHSSDGTHAMGRIAAVDSTGNPSDKKSVLYTGVFDVGGTPLASVDLTFSSGGHRDPGTDALHVNFDHADTRCLVVLREVRAPDFSLVSGLSWFVWRGAIDVSDKVLDGASLGVQWHSTTGMPSSELVTAQVSGAPSGFQRFMFELAHDTLPTSGLDSTLIQGFQLSLIPFINLPNGTRQFDHNRVPDLQSYVLWSGDTAGGLVPDGGPLGRGFAIAKDPKVCPMAGTP
jgi:hypothetical protein